MHYQRLRKGGSLEARQPHDPDAKKHWLKQAANAGDACVDWPWQLTSAGYGLLLRRPATHWALEFAGRPWHPPLGNYVLHSCDRKTCCNPAHLRWGTPAANSEDAKSRGLTARGDRQGAAKLTESDVLAIRDLYATKRATLRALAAQYGVSLTCIHGVVHRRLWKYVT